MPCPSLKSPQHEGLSINISYQQQARWARASVSALGVGVLPSPPKPAVGGGLQCSGHARARPCKAAGLDFSIFLWACSSGHFSF